MDQKLPKKFNWNRLTFILCAIMGIGFCVLRFHGCDPPDVQIPPQIDSIAILKAQINQDKLIRDALLKLADQKDSLHFIPIHHYHTNVLAMGDPQTAPCDSLRKYIPKIINNCDSIIKSDSSYIGTLKDVIHVDSTIISNYGRVVVKDSVEIVRLNKEVKRQRKHKRIAGGVGIIAIIVAIFK